MLNNLVLVGRIANDPTIEELEKGGKSCVITLAVSRSYKNNEGVYDTDFIDVTLYDGIATNTTEYCRKGDLVGVKGRIARLSGEELRVIAEKVTFLTSKKKDDEDE